MKLKIAMVCCALLITSASAAGAYNYYRQANEQSAWNEKQIELNSLAVDLQNATNPVWIPVACKRALQLDAELAGRAVASQDDFMNEGAEPIQYISPYMGGRCG